MLNPLRIFFVGEVSAGKSSLLNALAGGIISNASTQRETLTPEIYSFVTKKDMKAFPSFKKIATILEKKHIDNKNKKAISQKDLAENIGKPKIITDRESKPLEFKSLFEMGNYLICDFPGLNDSTDSNDIFFQVIEQNISECDCLVYITKAEFAFLSQSEVNVFNRLITLCETQKMNNGQHIQICIAVNKFDDQNNPDLIDIANDIPNKLSKSNVNNASIPIFRVSSHKLLIQNIIKHKLGIPVPKFVQQEIKKIFQNADVITTKEQKASIKNSGKISFKHIKYNENIEFVENDDDPATGNRNIKAVQKQECDEDSDSGSDFEDNPIESSNNKPKYNNKYDGDWNNFIDFIKNENMENIANKTYFRHQWLHDFMVEIPNVIFSLARINKQTMEFYDKIYQTFLEKHDMNKFIEETQILIKNNFDNELLMCTVMEHLFGKSTLSQSDRKKLGTSILSEVNKYAKNKQLKKYHIHLAIKSIEFFDGSYVSIKDITDILQNRLIWEVDTNNPIRYYDLSTNTYLTTDNAPSIKYQTLYVEQIVKNMSHYQYIRILIDLSFVTKNHLKILHSDNKIPYSFISHYLDKNAGLRLKMLLINDFEYNDTIPVLFNNYPNSPINIEVSNYLKVEGDLKLNLKCTD